MHLGRTPVLDRSFGLALLLEAVGGLTVKPRRIGVGDVGGAARPIERQGQPVGFPRVVDHPATVKTPPRGLPRPGGPYPISGTRRGC